MNEREYFIEKQKLNYMEQMTKERFFVLKEFKNDDMYSEFNVVDEKTDEDLEAVCWSVMNPLSTSEELFTKCSGSIDFNPAYIKDGELILSRLIKSVHFA